MENINIDFYPFNYCSPIFKIAVTPETSDWTFFRSRWRPFLISRYYLMKDNDKPPALGYVMPQWFYLCSVYWEKHGCKHNQARKGTKFDNVMSFTKKFQKCHSFRYAVAGYTGRKVSMLLVLYLGCYFTTFGIF